MRMIKAAVAAVGILALLASAPAPALADSPQRRSSNACTHNFFGTSTSRPDICIEIHGRGLRADRVVARWVGGGSRGRAGAILRENGKERKKRAIAHTSGNDLVAEWRSVTLSPGKVCVSFAGIDSQACQDVTK